MPETKRWQVRWNVNLPPTGLHRAHLLPLPEEPLERTVFMAPNLLYRKTSLTPSQVQTSSPSSHLLLGFPLETNGWMGE